MSIPVATFHDVPIACVNQAAETYAVPAELILAVIFVEGGRNGIAMPNKNGTFDYGVMQINSFWLKHFDDFETSAYRLQFDACHNVMVGTSILKQNINNTPNLMKAIGNYHSHTPHLNYQYAKQVLFIYDKIRDILAPGIKPECDKLGKIC